MSNDVGTLVWSELHTADTAASAEFFCSLLGWTQREENYPPLGRYKILSNRGVDIAGLVGDDQEVAGWSNYVKVADVDAVAARAAELGGSVIQAPTDIPNIGRFCVIADPQGAELRAFTPRQSGAGAP